MSGFFNGMKSDKKKRKKNQREKGRKMVAATGLEPVTCGL